MSTNDEQYRAGFEAWATSKDGGWWPGALERNPERGEDDYQDDNVQGEWRSWLASKREASTEPSALTDDEILDATMMVEPEPFGLSESGPEYMGYDLAIGRAVEAKVAARFRAAGRNTSDESSANTDEVGVGALPDEAMGADQSNVVPPFAAPASQHSADCRDCHGTGQADSGGVHPWGEPAMIPCGCDDLRTAVARAIWDIRRDEEDRNDMELEDMGESHSVWKEADAAIEVASGFREGDGK